MSKGYWIIHVTISDPDGYAAYLAQDKIAFDKFGAKFLVRGGEFVAPEAPSKLRHIVIEFESYEKAVACYRSPEYQRAVELRQGASQSEIVIVRGVD
ncbi:DUF1330 domain-containing protein [Hyphomicrobium sp.]|jgi:uncharacterized protein (DUF1330 family)|uniref:DUF1330 domain-containing protein n=1 Tax=Hyphomicrobium sp. TaxID=82 RepID=UPI000FABFB15|nr:DUF1330 domain-containing protein [Hyphomicrobium sp.]RUO97892.1 MAG: DUF1330 domain-containing protein [Hyphomicrobium sp.]